MATAALTHTPEPAYAILLQISTRQLSSAERARPPLLKYSKIDLATASRLPCRYCSNGILPVQGTSWEV